ncbi:WW domain-binding protein 4 [Anabrus simplex]|uniref:WW domain-binding protein 4 n=1 Tax=Anabrus simplex TaxID=316456 RepID=UPI0035A2EFB4
MADYWKSQAKKYCDFCKCWIADNRPSVEFHEKGKRHKENVTLRLKDISKKSAKQHKEMLSVDEEMKKMEEAALKAYMKDVEANADLTSRIIKEQLAEKEKQATEDEKSISLEEEEDGDDKSGCKEEQEEEEKQHKEPPQPEPESKVKMWYEAVSDEGYTYYWHIETGESVWEPPEEGFMSVAEQKEAEEKEAKKKTKEEKKNLRQKEEEERRKKEEEKQILEEQRAWVEREKMRSRRVKEEVKVEEPSSPTVIGPAPRIDPYGGWTKVETKVQEPVDLQLPEQEYVEIKVPVVSEPQVKFKEKTIASLDDDCGTSSSFKKRKFNSNSKRSMRQRLDGD